MAAGYKGGSKSISVGLSLARNDIDSNVASFISATPIPSTGLGLPPTLVERYPELKSDQNFRDLQAQLEGTENRITVARNRYIQSVQDYNVTVRSFPSNLTAMLFGYKPKANFAVENEAQISKPPQVDFSRPKP